MSKSPVIIIILTPPPLQNSKYTSVTFHIMPFITIHIDKNKYLRRYKTMTRSFVCFPCFILFALYTSVANISRRAFQMIKHVMHAESGVKRTNERTPCSWGRSDWLRIYWWLSAGSQGSAAPWFAALRETHTDRSIQRKHENWLWLITPIPSLQRRPNQTWAIWKWPSEISAWLLLLISQHACWSTPQSTATRRETDRITGIMYSH